ncbi:MAG: rod-binding protein [Treponema sp.]|jgi:flagellar protein FlgJ|nr:rod-binding protein [Treponema sp.]
METGNLGSLYFEDARFGAAAAGIGTNALERGPRRPGDVSFVELLEKSYGKVSRNEETTAPAQAPGPASPLIDKTSRLYEQCEALETFLVKILLNGMRSTVQKSGLIDEGFAGKMYEDMLYDEYAKDYTKKAGFGLAELAYLELTGQRGKSGAPQQ